MRVSSKVLALSLMAGCAMTTVSLALAQANGAGVGGGPVAQVFSGGTIRDIQVEGTQRIEPSTVRSYLTVQPGEPFDAAKIDESLKSLFGTGLFADVQLRRQGDVLVVAVQENPIINRIAFEGNRRIETEQLEKEIQLRPRVVYTRTRVQSDVQRMLDIYRRQGRFAATVEPKIIKLDQNRVDLVFEINEGERTGVRAINFVGNEHFSAGTLRENIQTRETAWWRFLTSEDSYDPDRVNYDRELLRLVALEESGNLRPRQVSGGMAQRASLARALARNPGVLLLDEPFGALDALTRLRMQDLLLDVHAAEPTTVLLVTHDVEEALYLADRVLLLRNLAKCPPGTPTVARAIDVPGARPRDRADHRLAELRAELLEGLGVATHHVATDPDLHHSI